MTTLPEDLTYTVTYLEMMARPARPQAPRPALPIMLLRCDTPSVRFYRYLYASVGDAWIWFERRLMPEADLGAILAHPGVSLHVLHLAGEPVGYFELDRRDPPAFDLAYFGLVPEATGKRLGPWLLDQAIHQAFDEGAERLRVNTCTLDSPKALPMYQRAGFVPVAQVERTIRNPHQRMAELPRPNRWIEI